MELTADGVKVFHNGILVSKTFFIEMYHWKKVLIHSLRNHEYLLRWLLSISDCIGSQYCDRSTGFEANTVK